MINLYLKAIDGEEMVQFTQESFDKVLSTLNYKEIKKSDRTLYFFKENIKFNDINILEGDYFEVIG